MGEFYQKLRWLGGNQVQGFSVPKDVREEMDLEEGDFLKVKVQKVEENEK